MRPMGLICLVRQSLSRSDHISVLLCSCERVRDRETARETDRQQDRGREREREREREQERAV